MKSKIRIDMRFSFVSYCSIRSVAFRCWNGALLLDSFSLKLCLAAKIMLDIVVPLLRLLVSDFLVFICVVWKQFICVRLFMVCHMFKQ